jgi:hypothetical protein
LQWGTHETPSHVTVPFIGAMQAALQAVAPQLLMSVFTTHLPPHRW